MAQPGPRHYEPHQVAALVRSAQAGDTMAVGDLLDLLTPYVRRLCGPSLWTRAPTPPRRR